MPDTPPLREQIAHAIADAIVKADTLWSEPHRIGLRQRERIVEFVIEAVLPLVEAAADAERLRLRDQITALPVFTDATDLIDRDAVLALLDVAATRAYVPDAGDGQPGFKDIPT